jgi:hypothetical protein
MNDYIAPFEFKGIVCFEDEHPLNEREAESGLRNVIVYHTAGEDLKKLKEISDIEGTIYKFTTIVEPEDKTWTKIYDKCLNVIEESGECRGFYIATATTSDAFNNGYQMAVVVKHDLNIAESLGDVRAGGCGCSIF